LIRNTGPKPGTDGWHALVDETVIEPSRPIIDPHHHLWTSGPLKYTLDDLWADTGAGHNVEKTVFVECRSNYRSYGDEKLRPIGETEFVVRTAEKGRTQSDKAAISGIVGHADLTLGEQVSMILEAHEEAGNGLFRGIRHVGAFDDSGSVDPSLAARPCPYGDASFRLGVKTLGKRGYSFDAWHFFHQSSDFVALANFAPNTLIILDHLASPIGVGAFANKKNEVFDDWVQNTKEVAACENVVIKLGGLAMPFSGFGWHEREIPPTSDEIVDAQKHYYRHAIECFGPDRCMFESNFPVDRLSVSYKVLWNAFKKMVADFSEEEKNALFYGTAARVYRL